MNTPREPGMDQLISALTADGRPDELAGRDAALTAFRAAGRRRDRADAPAAPVVPYRRPLTGWLPPRLTAIAAGRPWSSPLVVTAAYTHALPGPVQDAAHSVFAPLGVPGGQQGSSGTSPSQGPAAIIAATQPGDCPSCTTVFKTPSPRSGNHYIITLSGARVRVTAGVVAVLTGRVAQSGSPAAGVRVALVARTAASAQWRIVATGVTGPRGGFRFVTPPLTASAVFRVVAPDGAYSGPVRIAVPLASLPAGT